MTGREFDIFAKRPVQTAVQSAQVTHYKPIAPVDLSDLEFVIPGDIHISVRGKLVAQGVSVFDPADSTTVVKDLLHSLFSQSSITLNGV
jgi:hypothetical protein